VTLRTDTYRQPALSSHKLAVMVQWATIRHTHAATATQLNQAGAEADTAASHRPHSTPPRRSAVAGKGRVQTAPGDSTHPRPHQASPCHVGAIGAPMATTHYPHRRRPRHRSVKLCRSLGESLYVPDCPTLPHFVHTPAVSTRSWMNPKFGARSQSTRASRPAARVACRA
jgi:hypothetical protein